MIVIAIVAIALRMVIPAFVKDIPEAQVQSEARRLAAKLSYLRSESRLQGQRYGLEFEARDDEPHRYRIVMPREQMIVREGSELDGQELSEELALEWTYLPDTVRFLGVHVGYTDQDGAKARKVFFDPRGRTSQKAIYLVHRLNTDIVYSIVVPPLAGKIETTKGKAQFARAVDSDF
jgi:Tfp pilus assembly protein FimT